MMKNLLFSLLFLGLGLVLKGQNTYYIDLQSGPVWGEANLNEAIAAGWNPAEAVNGKIYRFMQFETLPGQREIAQLESRGIVFHDYIPALTWLVEIPANLNLQLLKDAGIRGLMPVPATAKLRQSLKELPLPAWALNERGKIDVHVLPFPGVAKADLNQNLENFGAEILTGFPEFPWAFARVRIADLERLAEENYVAFIEPVQPPEENENYVARGQHRATALLSPQSSALKYDGTGVVVAMGDNGPVGPHIDFTGRIDNSNGGTNFGDHGDHVAGTIMGAGNLVADHQGMAPGATLHAYAGGQVLIAAIQNAYSNDNVRIASTSQSNGCNAGYTLLAQSVDALINANSGLMMVYSAGNEGPEDCGYGAGSGYGNITGGHKVGKNCITVGALNSSDFIAGFSSRGPAHDGRIKPEVCGKGVSQWSTSENNTYANYQGTSMSCPGISGVMSQLYHAYRDMNGGSDPNSALIKMVMMNTAQDLGRPGPDYVYGYGRINGLRAYEALAANNYITDNVSTGQTDTFDIVVPAGAGELKVMTYWHDPTASVFSNSTLVNDLNMQVIDPNGTAWNPWTLDPTATVAALTANAVRGIETLNNHEQVTLDSLIPGTYKVVIEGNAVPQGPQDYYMTWTVIDSGVQMAYPYGGEVWVPGDFERIYWDAVGDHGQFRMEYSLDNGANWSVIDSAIPGSDRIVNWVVPNGTSATGEAWIRISRGTESDTTNFSMVIADQPGNLHVAAACPTNLTLEWNPVAGATGYVVYQLGTMYMDSIGTTTGTTFQVNGIDQFSAYWFSVAAVTPQGDVGRRADAIQKTPGIDMCQEPDDVGIVQIFAPGEGSMNNCGTSSMNPVVEIENYSPDTLTGFPVGISINGGTPLIENFSGTLLPFDRAEYVFTNPLNLGNPGQYAVKAFTGNSGDANPFNDTLEANVEVFAGTTVTLPYAEDFETFSTCSDQPNCSFTNCGLANGHHNSSNNVIDDIDWRTHSGTTPSSGTGPDMDHNPGTSSGKYVYLESTSCQDRNSYFITPCIDLTTATEPELTFWFHKYGTGMGDLHVDLNANGRWYLDIENPMIGDWGNRWWDKAIDLSPWNGEIVTIRFRGITGPDLSDMAVDDIAVTDNFIGVDPVQLSGINLYPNPSEGELVVAFENGANGAGEIRVIDINGKVVLQKTIQQGDRTLQLNGQDLPAGVYGVVVRTQEGIYRSKWVKI